MGAINMKPTVKKAISDFYDAESLFLGEMLSHYTFWKAKAAKLKEQGIDNSQERDYAEAFRVILHKFSMVD